jgi:hypothetical protein
VLLSVESNRSHTLLKRSTRLALVNPSAARNNDIFLSFVNILDIESFGVVVTKIGVLGLVLDIPLASTSTTSALY